MERGEGGEGRGWRGKRMERGKNGEGRGWRGERMGRGERRGERREGHEFNKIIQCQMPFFPHFYFSPSPFPIPHTLTPTFR